MPSKGQLFHDVFTKVEMLFVPLSVRSHDDALYTYICMHVYILLPLHVHTPMSLFGEANLFKSMTKSINLHREGDFHTNQAFLKFCIEKHTYHFLSEEHLTWLGINRQFLKIM